jgi:hypothetical protein
MTSSDTARWIERLWTDGGYRFAAACPPTLLATSCGVLALEHMQELGALGQARRDELCAAIAARQDPTGVFHDPLHDAHAIARVAKFTPLYLSWQQTYFALHALDALGKPARHPLDFVEPFADRAFLEVWLRTLRFDDFWLSSNLLMFLLYFLLLVEGDVSPTAHAILDALDRRQDPATGFWGTQQGASLFNGMAGAYHLFGFYRHLQRPIAHQHEALDATLRLQTASGLFGDLGGGPCEDVDAIDILVHHEPRDATQERAVHEALARALTALDSCKRDDGGYRWHAPAGGKPRPVRYSGLSSLTASSDEGDMWSAWFRPLAISLASQRIGKPPPFVPLYRRMPLLGYKAVA